MMMGEKTKSVDIYFLVDQSKPLREIWTRYLNWATSRLFLALILCSGWFNDVFRLAFLFRSYFWNSVALKNQTFTLKVNETGHSSSTSTDTLNIWYLGSPGFLVCIQGSCWFPHYSGPGCETNSVTLLSSKLFCHRFSSVNVVHAAVTAIVLHDLSSSLSLVKYEKNISLREKDKCIIKQSCYHELTDWHQACSFI